MSKASEWAAACQRRAPVVPNPPRIELLRAHKRWTESTYVSFGVWRGDVGEDTECGLTASAGWLAAPEALALARWIIETFSDEHRAEAGAQPRPPEAP